MLWVTKLKRDRTISEDTILAGHAASAIAGRDLDARDRRGRDRDDGRKGRPRDDGCPISMSAPSRLGLDGLNFFLADVQSGVGPFLAVYLASVGWNEEQVGVALTVGGIAGILAQTPAGGLVDRTRSKRALIAAGIVILAASELIVALAPSFWWVIASEICIGVGASVFVPAVCAISLGLVGRAGFDRRQGRNQTFNSAGNVFAAVVMGAIGYLLSNRGIFYFVVALAIPTLAALSAIRSGEIDYKRARGANATPAARPGGTGHRRPGRTLAIFMTCAVMFHFANAAMLSLLGEMLSKGQGKASMMYMSACVITTQAIITASAAWVSKAGRQLGTKAPVAGCFRRPAAAGHSLHIDQRSRRAGGDSDPRWRRGQHFWRRFRAGHRRPHQRIRAIQPDPGRFRHSNRKRRCAQPARRRQHRASCGIPCGIRVFWQASRRSRSCCCLP